MDPTRTPEALDSRLSSDAERLLHLLVRSASRRSHTVFFSERWAAELALPPARLHSLLRTLEGARMIEQPGEGPLIYLLDRGTWYAEAHAAGER
jgi:hypothetical protein